MDRTLNVLLRVSVAVCVMLMTGCTTTHTSWVAPSGQIMDGTNNPIYPDLTYTPVTMEAIDANGNPD